MALTFSATISSEEVESDGLRRYVAGRVYMTAAVCSRTYEFVFKIAGLKFTSGPRRRSNSVRKMRTAVHTLSG